MPGPAPEGPVCKDALSPEASSDGCTGLWSDRSGHLRSFRSAVGDASCSHRPRGTKRMECLQNRPCLEHFVLAARRILGGCTPAFNDSRLALRSQMRLKAFLVDFRTGAHSEPSSYQTAVGFVAKQFASWHAELELMHGVNKLSPPASASLRKKSCHRQHPRFSARHRVRRKS